ncbi:uncharacterized protein MONOS_18659 [Monocercomonoides exilis]|uniref:uncharacterized protein n=1 Tax=Monocercomonoides exilis TaxID=2049356 RepID=UPI003559F87C|nr:hypothetical protein MONOS_18659 [Monocercomonoides exilis]
MTEQEIFFPLNDPSADECKPITDIESLRVEKAPKEKKRNSNRNISLDIVKSVAAFFVLVIHSTLLQRTELKHYEKNGVEYQWHVTAIYVSLTQCCSSLFMTVSGILLLHPKHLNDSPRVAMKMFLKRSLIYIVWCIPYNMKYIVETKWRGRFKKTLFVLLNLIINGDGTFWYLYVLLFLHLATPFFQSALRSISRLSYELSLLSYWLVFQGLNGLRLLIDGWGKGTNFTNMMFFVLAGPFFYAFAEEAAHPGKKSGYHFVEDQEGILKWLTSINWKKPWVRVATFCTYIGSAFFMYLIWSYREVTGLPNGLFLTLPHCPFNSVVTISLFLFIYGCGTDWNPESKIGKFFYWFFSSTGSCTMGIYMLNEFFIFRLFGTYLPIWTGKKWLDFNPVWFSPCLAVTVYLICWIVTLIAKKIPGIRFFFQ